MTKNELLNDLYDTIKGTLIRKKDIETSDWSRLAENHRLKAKKRLSNYLRLKHIDLNIDKSEIRIGKNILLKVIIKGY